MPNHRIQRKVTIRHWFPILTFCPVNKLPDLLYVSLTVEDVFVELYAARKRIRKLLSGKLIFMEDAAELVLKEFSEASSVTVALAFNRHIVTMKRTLL